MNSTKRIKQISVGLLVFFLWIIPSAGWSQTQASNDRPLILAHYMPWYVAKPFSKNWGWHWTMNHFDPEQNREGRREIASKFYPLIGPYDSGDPAVLEYHLLLMKLAGIDGVIVDWYGMTDVRDYALLNRNAYRLLQQAERLKMKFAICYEDQTVPVLVKAKRIQGIDRVNHVASEISWLNKYWFQSGSYAKIDGKPLLLSFGHDGLTGKEWGECLKRLDFPVAYFSQGVPRPGAAGCFDWPVPSRGLKHNREFLKRAETLPAAIPTAFPRFEDIYKEAKVGKGYGIIRDRQGETFRSTLREALAIDPVAVQLTTWNDWGEGTQIEPSREFGYRDLQVLQKELGSEGIGASTEDLAIPLRIYRLRQVEGIPSKTVDGIVNKIVDRKLEEARKELASVESQFK